MVYKSRIATEAQGIASGVSASIDTLREKIDEIRERVSGLKSERVQVEQSSISKGEAMARLDEWLADLRERGRIATQCLMSRDRSTPVIIHDANISEARRTVDMRDASSALVFLFHDSVRKTLAAEVETLYADETDAVESKAYDKRLSDLDRDLLALEMEEERLISYAENAGVIIHRRADADPRVLLED
ncbi:hypothetical protein [Dyella jiangningensis]|uniref:Uncharacterized protein n=1 Tax=Dyella jiangningensis TaxID=1379159 RepID=A0A328P1A7_9GAMM|nr:hypothetical protein [Dyella jiangningensis]RAO75789.1 hypothetical protein CA260_17275 [Dyella jiangningensis]